MNRTGRDRREWQILFWVLVASAVASIFHSYVIAPEGSRVWPGIIGLVTNLVIATPIILTELRAERFGVMRRLRRLPLVVYFGIKVVFYLVVIVAGIVGVTWAFAPLLTTAYDPMKELRRSLVFAIELSIAANLIFEIGGLVGFRTLGNLLRGRYVQPRREHRAFLLIDMKNSTGLAEQLGSVRFHELLNVFFQDVADAALDCEAEIHKYVGDEAILTWPESRSISPECLECPFMLLERIERRRRRYMARFGLLPTFRAALHYGEIVAGEIGVVRREIAFVGDTLNVAARLLDAAKEIGRDVLVSEDMLAKVSPPDGIAVEKLPMLTVRGREAPLGIAAVSRT
jgi:class 3 adenylate cyclase